MSSALDLGGNQLARVAHELSQPLNALMAAARVVGSVDDRAALDKARLVIERQAGYMQALVHDLLEDARQQRSQWLLRCKRLDMRHVVEDVLDANEAVFAEHDIDAVADLPDEPAWVDGDPVRLQEVLWNLITNAVRHTPRGGQVAGRVRSSADRVVIAIADTGIGLQPGELGAIFEPLVQGEHRSAQGLGLGLAVARELAKAHGGTIDVRSAGRGRGSEFRMILPAAGNSRNTAEPARANAAS